MILLELNGKYGSGKITEIDTDDFEKFSIFNWRISRDGYVVRGVKDGGVYKTILLHREILKAPQGLVVDHIDGNKLNNQKTNLRLATSGENSRNCMMRANSSGFKGVLWDENKQRWSAHIAVNRKKYHIGQFDNKEDAARAYDYVATSLHGEFARLNFPGEPLIPYERSILNNSNTSGYRGVCWHKKTKKWSATIRKNGETFNLGYFEQAIDAAYAYDRKASELYGNKAPLNFPNLRGKVI